MHVLRELKVTGSRVARVCLAQLPVLSVSVLLPQQEWDCRWVCVCVWAWEHCQLQQSSAAGSASAAAWGLIQSYRRYAVDKEENAHFITFERKNELQFRASSQLVAVSFPSVGKP